MTSCKETRRKQAAIGRVNTISQKLEYSDRLVLNDILNYNQLMLSEEKWAPFFDKGCFMMAVGKAATSDGSVMVARSCDALGDFAQKLLAVPRKEHGPGETLKFKSLGVEISQVRETYSYVSVMAVRDDLHLEANGGINEFQVSAGASSGGAINKRAERVSPSISTSLGDFRMTLVLERCKTAREGIKLIGELTERYGARTDNYIVADPNEVWLYEEYLSHLWVAAKLPDDCFVVEANTSRIGEVDLDDPSRFLSCSDLASFAAKNGLYDPKSGKPLNVAEAFGYQIGKMLDGVPTPNFDRRRIWRAISLLAPSKNLNPEEPRGFPLFVKPDHKLTPKDLLSVFTDHYEGTEYDTYGMNKKKYRPMSLVPKNSCNPTKGQDLPELCVDENMQYQLAPVWGKERILGVPAAVTTWCAQLRSWLPNPIGGLLWTGLGEGATCGHIPIYAGITRTPEGYAIADSVYDDQSAYWNFRAVSNLVNLFYTATAGDVIPVWRAWESKLYELQPIIERNAMELYQKNPGQSIDYITTYSCDKAREALEIAKIMIAKLHTIIAHYDTPLPTSSRRFTQQ
jgi:dipeptidase